MFLAYSDICLAERYNYLGSCQRYFSLKRYLEFLYKGLFIIPSITYNSPDSYELIHLYNIILLYPCSAVMVRFFISYIVTSFRRTYCQLSVEKSLF